MTQAWRMTSQQELIDAIAPLRQALEHQATPNSPISPPPHLPISPSAALHQLCHTFALSPFERDLLLLCAGMELDSSWGQRCANAQGNPKCPYPTFNLALTVLASPDWAALTPAAPLRHWRLIELGEGTTLIHSPLRIDECILHYLLGISHLDQQLSPYIQKLETLDWLVESHQRIAEQIAEIWQLSEGEHLAHAASELSLSKLPIVQLCGSEIASKRAIATTVCQLANWQLYTLSIHALPTALSDIYSFLQLWQRQAKLSRSALLIDCDTAASNDSRESAIALLLERLTTPMILSGRDRRPPLHRPIITFDIPKPTTDEQRSLWHKTLNSSTEDNASSQNTNTEISNSSQFETIEMLVSQFNLDSNIIQAISLQAKGSGEVKRCIETKAWKDEKVDRQKDEKPTSNPALPSPALSSPAFPPLSPPSPALLWTLCRNQARPQLEDLSQRIPAKAAWTDLVLPEAQRQTLQEAIAHLRQRMQVYERWGFARKGDRGLGISALFAGASGTGKTMAAEVMARELDLDLYRIDLSATVSKYIGETEKNLRRIFDAAESGGAILLFDEADALFGKRSEVKDSHDRYANMEVSYLLQRMEAYQGLAILTTNLKESIDTAFLRRIRFIVKFPYPDYSQRVEIWQRIFPADTPTENLDYKKLAKLNLAGGNIRNIALNAAFLAADAGQPVKMQHLLSAAQSEYVKLERSLTTAEVSGWV